VAYVALDRSIVFVPFVPVAVAVFTFRPATAVIGPSTQVIN